MKWISGNRGNIIATLLVAVLGVFLGLVINDLRYGGAEAVIGGVGNVTDTANPHNLSAGSLGINAVSETQVCIFCHTPHNAIIDNTIINAPLWNHTLSSQTYLVKASGTSYTNSGFGITVNLLTSPPSKPDGASKLCLSCHDGTVSIGDLATADVDMNANVCLSPGSPPFGDKLINATGCNAYIGNDLTTKHVVSIPMNQQLLDASVANCGMGGQTHKLQYPWSAGGSIPDTVLLRPTASTYGGNAGVTRNVGKYKDGYNYGVQCSTCHDPHLWASTTAYSTGWKFLVIDFNTLCGACHIACP